MPRFAANLTFLWPGLPLIDRIDRAAAAEFAGVEMLFPYDVAVQEVAGRLHHHGLTCVLINAPPPNYAGGIQGFAAVPEAEGRFGSDLRRALRYVRVLGAQRLHLMAGVAEGPEALACFKRNLALAVAAAPRGLMLTIEPINRTDMPGYFLSDFALAAQIIEEIAAPNLRLQFDAYHAHRITGDVVGTWAAVAPLVGHVQVAGFPGRHEPMGGEIDYPAFFERLDGDGYGGWVSGEYHPKGGTEARLGWRG